MPPNGRDPFFPNSHRRDPQMAPNPTPTPQPASSELVLKGIVGSANHRLALINDDSIMEVGEEGSVRVPGGHVKLRCLEIGEDYAVIQVAGEVQTKRLQLSKKGL
jgi:type II secretory pathway component PulC